MTRDDGGSPQSWTSRRAFLLAAIGGAVGLGNIWKFPYMVGENGGGAFVLVYLAAVVLVAIPILMAEFLIGKRARRSPPGAMGALAREFRAGRAWIAVGWVGVLAAFLVLAFFGAVAAWAIAYIPKAAGGALNGLSGPEVEAMFAAMLADPAYLAALNAGYLGAVCWIIARGLRDGIERAVEFLMPALFILLMILVVYAAVAGDFAQGAGFLFKFDFARIDGAVALKAFGQAFLSIGVAMGMMMTFGAYIPKGVSILRAAAVISLADTGVAILAGLAIFPIVFAHGLDPAAGPGLVFVIFPLALGSMPGGAILGTAFFLLLVIATLTSSIAVLEPAVAWAEERLGIGRAVASAAFGVAAWVLGLGTYLSFAGWAEVYPLGFVPALAGLNIFGLVDFLITNLMLPITGFLIAIFAGWVMSAEATRAALDLPDGPVFTAWRLIIRYLAPIILVVIFAAKFI